GSDTLPTMCNRKLVESVLQSDELGIEIGRHGVHLFTGLPLSADEAEHEAAPQGAQLGQVNGSHLGVSPSVAPGRSCPDITMARVAAVIASRMALTTSAFGLPLSPRSISAQASCTTQRTWFRYASAVTPLGLLTCSTIYLLLSPSTFLQRRLTPTFGRDHSTPKRAWRSFRTHRLHVCAYAHVPYTWVG